jgi:hypothetical protein
MEINLGTLEAVGVVATIVGGFVVLALKYESRISKLEANYEPISKLDSRINLIEQDVKSLDIMKDIISDVGRERVQTVFKEKKE